MVYLWQSKIIFCCTLKSKVKQDTCAKGFLNKFSIQKTITWCFSEFSSKMHSLPK